MGASKNDLGCHARRVLVRSFRNWVVNHMRKNNNVKTARFKLRIERAALAEEQQCTRVEIPRRKCPTMGPNRSDILIRRRHFNLWEN
eukprot:11172889-Lingulodinium_polyedra.AAC.1